ncbi:terminase large subunit [Nitratireductor aquibiodomus]|uniref:terminase TerL endonuclease subunit n=1 Tax=Nitratireductor aquibiodomus TaxID=204799 RepID=UPI0019D32054|nr:terminase large subunit [Nitratireductor aquibiodomus]
MKDLLPNLAWIFDDSPIPDPHGKGEAAVRFIKALKHPKSKLPGQAFDLSPWQERIVRKVYGDTLSDGTRRVNELFLMVGRGNRKTSLMAACLMLHLVGPERRPGSTIASIANSREQAGLTFKEMAGICRATPRILEAVRIQDTEKRITYRKHDIAYEALSSDAKNAHGRTDVCAFWDEGHAEKKEDLLEAVETGLNKSDNTLLLSASTAGIGRIGPFWNKYEHARKITDGRVQDETFLPILFEAPADVDWRSDDWLYATNPGLQHGYPNIKKLKRYRERCEHSPAERESFKRLHLSVYLDGAANPEWDLAIWDENGAQYDLEALRGRKAWLAVDLSKRIDLSAVATVIELDSDDGEPRYALHVIGFSPEAQLRKRADNDSAPYPLWADQGWLTVCPGDIVDRVIVEEHIREIGDMFDVQEVAFDVALARELMENLESSGVPVTAFPQTLMNFAKPVDTFEDLFLNRRLSHGGNPLLRWAVGNTVMMRDQNDNRRPNKARAADRIDPAVAAIMAVSRAAQGASGRSSYDTAPDDFPAYI